MKKRFVKYAVFALIIAGFAGCSKVKTGAVVENEKEFAPVDKYLKVKDRFRAMSKHERRIKLRYFSSLSKKA